MRYLVFDDKLNPVPSGRPMGHTLGPCVVGVHMDVSTDGQFFVCLDDHLTQDYLRDLSMLFEKIARQGEH